MGTYAMVWATYAMNGSLIKGKDANDRLGYIVRDHVK